MSYGAHLDAAAVALAAAHARLRHARPASATDRTAAALARARLYRSLAWQVATVGGLPDHEIPRGDQLGRITGVSRAEYSALGVCVAALQAATGRLTAGQDIHLGTPIEAPVACALDSAAGAVQLAGDVLASNTGPYLRRLHQPLTAEGMAILAGAGRDDNVALLARLAATATEIDIRLVRWLWPEDAPGQFQPVLHAAEADAWTTKNGPLHQVATFLAAIGQPHHAAVRTLTAVAPADNPALWNIVSTGRGSVAAIDAARAWLTRHGHEITIGQLTAAAGAALAITRYVGYLHATLPTSAIELQREIIGSTESTWRKVIDAAADLRSPTLPHLDHGPLTAALGAAAQWLEAELHPHGHWRTPPPWTIQPASRTAWVETASQITARLPDLAALLDRGIALALEQGRLLTATGRLRHFPGKLIRVAEWQPTEASDAAYRAVRAALRNAGRAGTDFAAATGVPLQLGLADALAARATDRPPHPAHLAAQWYPAGTTSIATAAERRAHRDDPSMPEPFVDRSGVRRMI